LIVSGDYKSIGAKNVTVELAYASESLKDESEAKPKQSILGGPKKVPIKPGGQVTFANLAMSEASTKHGEKEFCLQFSLADANGKRIEQFIVTSTPFYAFSNTKVLARRRGVKLRVLSKNWGSYNGGEILHVVGNPFIKGPSLRLVFRTPRGDIPATNLDRYSDTVLFFTSPPYQYTKSSDGTPPPDLTVKVMVTNDGRNFSNALDFTYTAKAQSMRSYL